MSARRRPHIEATDGTRIDLLLHSTETSVQPILAAISSEGTATTGNEMFIEQDMFDNISGKVSKRNR